MSLFFVGVYVCVCVGGGEGVVRRSKFTEFFCSYPAILSGQKKIKKETRA